MRILKRIFIAGALISGVCFLSAANAAQPGEYFTKYFKDLEMRSAKGKHTLPEKVMLSTMYNSMIGVGYVLYPEAAEVLYLFCHGDGKNAKINSDYIRNSPVVQKRLKKLKPGQTWSGWFHQTEDVRLSYAYNPIKIENLGSKVRVSSPIRVAKLGEKVYTRFYMGPLTFDLPDSLMRVGCKSKEYTAYTEWSK